MKIKTKAIEEEEQRFDPTFGEVFQKLRKSKKFNQKLAALGVISVTRLSKFETGKSMVSGDKLFALLENIRVTPAEYEDARNRSLRMQDVLLYDMDLSDAFVERDARKMESVLKEIKAEIGQNPKIQKYKLDKCHAEAAISLLDSSQRVPAEDVLLLRSYFLSLKDWSYYDCLLFSHSVQTFDIFTVYGITERMIHHADGSRHSPAGLRAFIEALINIVDEALTKEAFPLAEEVIGVFKSVSIPDDYIGEKLALKYSEARYAYLAGDSRNLDPLHECRNLFLDGGFPSMARLIEREIARLEKNFQKVDDGMN